MLYAVIRKIMYTPVNPSFIIYKWGLRGSKLYRHVFVMQFHKIVVMAFDIAAKRSCVLAGRDSGTGQVGS